MESTSAVTTVIGLVSSLENTLRVLCDLSLRFALEEFGHDFKWIEKELANSHCTMVKIQRDLRTKWMLPQSTELMTALNVVSGRLQHLQETIERTEKIRTKLLFRMRVSRFSHRHEVEAAKSSILLAQNLIIMIIGVQSRKPVDQLLIERANSRDRLETSIVDKGVEMWQRTHLLDSLEDLDPEAERVLEWFGGPDERVQEQFHHRCRAERVAGIGEWFLDSQEFKSWSGRGLFTGDESILWCEGKPGIGKTMLASKIIDELRPLQFVAFFYFDNGAYSATDLALGLLKQLCFHYQIIPDYLEKIFEKVYERSNDGITRRLNIEDLLKALEATSQSIRKPITIVIDGLDELSVMDENDFVEFLNSLKKTSWKFFITSRPNQGLVNRACHDCHQFSIQEDHIAGDIHNFVDSALSGNEAIDKMLLHYPELRSDILRTVTSRAHGLIHWATLQTRLILDQTHISGLRHALRVIPDDIRGIVQYAIEVIRMQNQPRAELAIRTLAFLANAAAPITIDGLCHAMGFAHVLDSGQRPKELPTEEIPQPMSLIQCCSPLITVDPITGTAKLANYDIVQYMRQHCCDLFPHEKVRLARTCLRYLSMRPFSNGACHDQDILDNLLQDFPFLDYAARHWSYHTREVMSDLDITEDLDDDAVSLFKNTGNFRLCLQILEIKARQSYEPLCHDQLEFASLLREINSTTALHIAAREGLTGVVERLVKADGQSISRKDSKGTSALHEAAASDWLEVVDILLHYGAQPSCSDQKGKIPLYYALRGGHAEVVSRLERVEETNEPTYQMLEEALYDAAKAGQFEVVEFLLGKNVKIEARSRALILACQKGHVAIVNLLLEEDADPNWQSSDLSRDDDNALRWAVILNNERMVSTLLNHRADMEAEDSMGQTALFHTISHPRLEIASVLLQRGANLSAQDNNGNTVLHRAGERGASGHARLFIDQGIHVDIRNSKGMTPLMIAVHQDHHTIAMNLLRTHANVNVLDFEGRNPLMHAVLSSNLEMCRTLLRWGALPLSSEKYFPLHLAAAKGDVEIIEMLLESNKANVDCHDEAWCTPLATAAAHSRTQALDTLLEHNAQVDSRNEKSETPLMAAVAGNHRNAVVMLLDNGADINAATPELTTSLKIASASGYDELVKLLLERGARLPRVDEASRRPFDLAKASSQDRVSHLFVHDVDYTQGKDSKPLTRALDKKE